MHRSCQTVSADVAPTILHLSSAYRRRETAHQFRKNCFEEGRAVNLWTSLVAIAFVGRPGARSGQILDAARELGTLRDAARRAGRRRGYSKYWGRYERRSARPPRRLSSWLPSEPVRAGRGSRARAGWPAC